MTIDKVDAGVDSLRLTSAKEEATKKGDVTSLVV